VEKELDYMIEKFPQYRAKLIHLFNNNDDFRSLCDDYWQCNYCATKFTSNVKNEARIENNYKVLSLALEQEVQNYLDI
jgi:predicted secreted protein